MAKCPRLLDLLLFHAGIFNDGEELRKRKEFFFSREVIPRTFPESTKTYVDDLYFSTRRYDLLAFWKNVCFDEQVRDLMLKFKPATRHTDVVPGPEKRRNRGSSSRSSAKPTHHRRSRKEILGLSSAGERIQAVIERAKADLVDPVGEDPLFASGAGVGTQELSGQRILQIATILRNLSFEEDNAHVLAKSISLLRFCLLCCSTKWCNLNQMGFDILSNVSTEVTLEAHNESCVTDVILSTLTTYISSSDRFQVISSLDILSKLCQQEANDEFIGNILVGCL